ncbi:MAG: hypothetical protein RRZ24_08130 [Clostridia bacterium]
MCLPDAPHLYELHADTLDRLMDLKNGIFLNELHRKIDGHILSQYTHKGWYLHAGDIKIIRNIDPIIITTAEPFACIAFYETLGFCAQDKGGRWE